MVFNKEKEPDRIEEKLAKNGLTGEPYYYIMNNPPVQRIPLIMWFDGEIKTGSPELLFRDPLL